MAETPENYFSSGLQSQHICEACLNRLTNGESEALAALYDQTCTLVYSVALRFLGNSADAEEVTMDVYAYVWRSAASYNSGRGSVSAWLTMLTRSRAIDRLRTSTSSPPSISTLAVGIQGINALASSNDRRKDDDRRILVTSALCQLPVGERELLDLAFYAGLSHQELALRLGIPLGTVKSRLRAAISRLRELLGAASS